MIYSRGNAAKQWILEQLDRRYAQAPFRILDLGCGTAKIWQIFLEHHPGASLHGVDIDSQAIAQGKDLFMNNPRVHLEVFDAQQSLSSNQSFDVVIAFSAIEHVVDRPAFLKTVWESLGSGGLAYLNYDVGHFRSYDVKERLMVPVSQLLARFGIQGPYMKRVDDHLFSKQAEQQGFKLIGCQKNNLGSLKGFMAQASNEAIETWGAFEEKLNQLFSADQLDQLMWSTTLVLQKP